MRKLMRHVRGWRFIVPAILPMLLEGGCAGSATHDVMAEYQANDGALSCEQISVEIAKAQTVIDGVNKDKEDLSGADVVDGLLWFPFNLIAKSSNYKDALSAASDRIARLESLRTQKDCPARTTTSGLAEGEQEPERKLTGAQLIAVYTDTTVDVFQSENSPRISSDNTISYLADGTMTGKTKSGGADDGRWWVEDDRLCRQWERWQAAEVDCYAVMLRGNRIRWLLKDGATDSLHRLRDIPRI